MRNYTAIALSILALAAFACEPERSVEEYEKPGFSAPEVTQTESATAPGSPGGTALVPSVESGATVPVMISDGRIAIDTNVPAGAVVLNVTNSGSAAHDLSVEGEGVSLTLGGPLEANQQKTLELTLEPGKEYTVYCPLLDHRTKGEETKFTAAQ